MSISKQFDLDQIDKDIIQLLQNEPNITHSEIAIKIGRSQPAIGSRIKRLQNKGIISSKFGFNFKNALNDIFLVKVELQTKNPEEVWKVGTHCPFIINCMRLSGKSNILIFIASSSLKKIDRVIDYHFRNRDYISAVKMDIITDFSKDFVLPIDFSTDNIDPDPITGCGSKCPAFKPE